MSARPNALARRLHALQRQLEEHTLDALLVSHLPNLAYLTGLRSSAGVALVSDDGVRLIVDSRYLTAARALSDADTACPGLEVVLVDASYEDAIRRELMALGTARVGIESAHVTVKRWTWLTSQLDHTGITLVPVEGLVETGRLIKDEDEVDRLETGAQLLAGAVEPVLRLVRPGRSEREIAAEIELALAAAGFDDRAFPTIVASGPNSALPHAQPSTRRVEPSDLVLLDFGGIYDGYHVDLSRTICVGDATEDAVRLHGPVLEAQTNAIRAVGPGVPASAIDAAARETLARYDLADAFGHSTGHGLGLEIHEAPRIGRVGEPGADIVVQVGMVFTIEPGVYVPGVGGVRIEDDVLVTPDGCDVLTDAAPRGLTVGSNGRG